MKSPFRVPLLGALLLLLAAALTASLVPAGVALDRRIESELRRVAVEDLGRAPMILEDRNAAGEEALAMHAMSVAMADGLRSAVDAGRLEDAAALAGDVAGMYDEDPVLLARDGTAVVGPEVGAEALDALRRGESRVEYVYYDGMPRAVGLAPLGAGPEWAGAAGSASALDEGMATTLAALARADVTIVAPDGSVVASTLAEEVAAALVSAEAGAEGVQETEKVRLLAVRDSASWVARGTLADAGAVLFSRSVAQELEALPGVRRGALVAGFLTLILALGVGSLVAFGLARPVGALAQAAVKVSEGDFEAPVPPSRLEEVDRLGGAFRTMRESLRARIQELANANQELEDRQRKLTDLQTELIQRDRLASSARMAAELAHEIRNPVANVRNCLEVVRRTLPDGSESAGFADMAIDELLRMHELAEQLLDLNRPADPGAGSCDAGAVVEQVAALARVGDEGVPVEIRRSAPGPLTVAIAPDALKQILFNLVDNAREAAGTDSEVVVEVGGTDQIARVRVLDEGPGIPDDVLPHIFDPFFTTKEAVTGVGLGLFVAEGLARRYGGRLEAANRTASTGAGFTLEVPRMFEEPA